LLINELKKKKKYLREQVPALYRHSGHYDVPPKTSYILLSVNLLYTKGVAQKKNPLKKYIVIVLSVFDSRVEL
jgi:hypothetical protein